MESMKIKFKVTLEQVVAGCLLIWQGVDGYILGNVLDTLRENGFEIENPQDFDFKELYDYVDCKKDEPPFQGYVFTKKKDAIKDGIGTVHNIYNELRRILGPTLEQFFSNATTQSLLRTGDYLTESNKRRILNDAKVLLISDRQEDYDAFISYGFKNVSFFKSRVRANAFFEDHPSDLEQFHILVVGHQVTERLLPENLSIEKYMRNASVYKKITIANLSVYDDGTSTTYSVFYDHYQNRSKHDLPHSSSYNEVLENIMLTAKANGILFSIIPTIDLDRPKLAKDISFDNLIDDRLPVAQRPIPKKMKDLRILFLDFSKMTTGSARVAAQLGLNVTFVEDNNYAFSKIQKELSNYDIIIGSQWFSKNLSQAHIESTEQSKDTGTPITLLATYDWDPIFQIQNGKIDKALHIDINYCVGGQFFLKDSQKEISTFPIKLGYNTSVDECAHENNSHDTAVSSILIAAVSLYRKWVSKLTEDPSIQTEGYFATSNSSHEEDTDSISMLVQKQSLIETLDYISNIATKYLRLRQNNRRLPQLKDVIITESSTDISIEINNQGAPLCTLTLPKNPIEMNTRKFTLKTIKMKGRQIKSPVITLGVNIVQSRKMLEPNETQRKCIEGIRKKLETTVVPLLDSQKSLSLNPSNKNAQRKK